jgi:hypothetical protein
LHALTSHFGPTGGLMVVAIAPTRSQPTTASDPNTHIGESLRPVCTLLWRQPDPVHCHGPALYRNGASLL